MKALFKYAIVLALGLAAGLYAQEAYLHWPMSLEDVAKLNWLDDIDVTISNALTPAKPEAAVAPAPGARSIYR